MNEREPFEDIIASKFEEADFPFNEGDWDAAEGIISSHRTKEKRRRFAWIFLSGISLGVLIMLPFVIGLRDDAATVISEKSITASQAIAEKQAVSPVHPATPSRDVDNAQALTLGDSEDLVVENPIVEGVERFRSELIAEKRAIAHTATPIPENSGIASEQKLAEGNRITTSENNSPIGRGVRAEVLNSFLENRSEGVEGFGSNDERISPIPLSYINQKSLSVKTLLHNDAFAVLKPDSSIVMLDLPSRLDMDNAAKLMKPWNITAAIGGNYVNGYSFNPIQGIEISKEVVSNIELGAGIYYTYLSVQAGGLKEITTSINYGFGYESEISEIKTSKVHYAVVPIYANYNVNNKNTLIVGANVFTMITTSNSFATYKDRDGEREQTSTEKTSGYTNGINAYDVGVLLGYKRHLIGDLGAAIYFNYGLKDIEKDDYYNENSFDRNVSGQIMLTYKLR